MKLALGTAQFGLHYGVNNKEGTPSDEELKQILNLANENNITLLDSATCYGNALERIAKFNHQRFDIASKLKPLNTEKITPNTIDTCLKELEETVNKSGLTSLHTIMFHNAGDLYTAGIRELITELKTSELCRNVGASFYPHQAVLQLAMEHSLDIVQIPLNVADQQLLANNTIANLKKTECEIHIRSVFLQGLLLMKERPHYFDDWSPWFERFYNTCKSAALSPIQLCLAFAKTIDEVDKIILGVNNSDQLADILVNYHSANFDYRELTELATSDSNFINPVNWKI